MGSDPSIAPEDLELLDRVAARVVDLHLELPALLSLETGKPLSLLAGQTLVFFEPMVQSLFSFPDYRRFALLIERRDVVDALIERIERRADETRRPRRPENTGAPPGPTGP
jgi:hypothetical protein